MVNHVKCYIYRYNSKYKISKRKIRRTRAMKKRQGEYINVY